MGSQAKSLETIARLQERVDDSPQMEALQKRLADLSEEVRAAGASMGNALDARLHEICSSGALALADDTQEQAVGEETALVTSQLQSDCSDLQLVTSQLHRRFDALQTQVDEQVLVSLRGMLKELPEAMGKVDRLLAEENERFCKMEENDVRLCTALTKLENCEQKVRDCMGRLERTPSSGHVRTLCHEELHKVMGDINLDGLSKRLDGAVESISEITEGQQRQAAALRSLTKRVSDDEARVEYELAATTIPLQCMEQTADKIPT